MVSNKLLLGKVFISHSSSDKPFVRRLAEAIENAGFKTWLDEKELMPGDPLAKRISEALDNSRAVLVVVSAASIASRWLGFELNKATERMVKGECRVIPVVIEKVNLPPEVAGLLYSDFTDGFDLPLKGILTALEHEARTRSLNHSFWSRAEVLVEETFHGTGFVFIGAEYKDKDYNVVYLYPDTDPRSDHTAVYETVSGYSSPERPLTELWWTEYSNSISELDETLFLVLTERPVEFSTETATGFDSRISFKSIGYKDHIHSYVVFVSLSPAVNEAEQQSLIGQAKMLLRQLDENLRPQDAA